MAKIPISLILASCMFLPFLINSLAAQDVKVKKLYDQGNYCGCVIRCDKVLSKKSSAEVLYYKAASLVRLYRNNDQNCGISNPLKKSIQTLARLNRYKKDTSGLRIKELEHDIVSTYAGLYGDAIKQGKWKSAIGYIDNLLSYKPKCVYLIDKAFCEYSLNDMNAISSLSEAIHCSPASGNDTSGLFTRGYEMMKELERGNRLKEQHQLMDTLIRYYPGNGLLASEINTNLLQKLFRYKHHHQYDSLLEYSVWLRKTDPENQVLHDAITRAIRSVADSLTDQYEKSDTSIQALAQCAAFLVNTRLLLGDYISLNQCGYYSLLPGKKKKFTVVSLSDQCVDFSAGDNPHKYYSMNFRHASSLVPCREVRQIPGYLWREAPKQKRAQSATDMIRKETLNYLLLDTLTHAYCNKFRRENHQPKLKWSNDCYRASRHHAGVMAGCNAIWHGEEIDSTDPDIDSVKMYMNMFYGENCQYLGMGSETYTYDELARQLIENWKTSPGHRRNMLRDYKIESVSTVFVSTYYLFAILANDRILEKYLPEYKRFFDLVPGLKTAWFDFCDRDNVSPSCYSSQNFH